MMMTEVIEFLGSGGFVMPPLAIATVVLWYALGWRMVTLSAPKVSNMISDARAAVGRVKALHRISDADRQALVHEITFGFEEECRKYQTIIRTIVMVAPLAGLLGTVGGMIETFDALGDMSLFSQSGGIAGGIAQALISTQMGLAVAIPGLVVGRLLDRRSDNVISVLRGLG